VANASIGRTGIHHASDDTLTLKLTTGAVGVFFTGEKVMVGRGVSNFKLNFIFCHTNYISAVLAIYTQSGAKHSPHTWQLETSNIGNVSYLAVQVYEQAFFNCFRGVHDAIHRNIGALRLNSFSHIHADHFLQVLPGLHSVSDNTQDLQLEKTCLHEFLTLEGMTSEISKAILELRRRRKTEKKVN
jgi:ribonuclease BN (tRNA processing enzyme)